MTEGNSFSSFEEVSDWFYLLFCFICISCSALASGLTIGLLSFDTLKLQIKTECGTEAEKIAANRILPLLDKRHDLLCTLLVFNSIASESLPVFLDSIVPSYAAIIISVTLVLICGEVVPVAFFTGPDQVRIRFITLFLNHPLFILLFPQNLQNLTIFTFK